MSASITRSQRGRRGRVMLVGESAALNAVAEALAQPPARVLNMFEAIGEVTAAGATEPIIAVVVSDELLMGLHRHAAEALRKVDPSVRIVGLASGSAAPTTETRGVDAWLTATSLRRDDITRALDDDALVTAATTITATTPVAAVDTAPPAAPTPAPADRVIELVESAADAADADADVANAFAIQPSERVSPPGAPAVSPKPPNSPSPVMPAAANPQAAGAAASHVPAPPSTPIPTAAAIGDTDLINALLHDDAGVLPTALRVIAYHTNWNDVFVLDGAAESTRDTATGAEIARGSQRFGRLIARTAPALHLRMWADWLAHWLAIEHNYRARANESLTDDLTAAGNRRFFERFLRDAIAAARRDRRPLSVMVFDIDNFKKYNDQFGHAAGDDILREIVRMLKSVIRQGDAVCRIGGDEFVVVFADAAPPRTPGSKPPENVESIARRFQAQVCSMRFPKLGVEAPGTLSISAGLATYPWDGHDPESLLKHADELAMESKRKGKNALTLGRGAAESCRE